MILSLYPPASYLSILPEELCSAIEQGERALAEAAIQLGAEEMYAIKKKPCTTVEQNIMCLFLYTYALESYCTTDYNYMSEAQLIAVLSCVEQTSKSCCNG